MTVLIWHGQFKRERDCYASIEQVERKEGNLQFTTHKSAFNNCTPIKGQRILDRLHRYNFELQMPENFLNGSGSKCFTQPRTSTSLDK
jgi:hypothetical protein